MSFLVQQQEVNDCGVAICTMILNQINPIWSLEKFKVKHQYLHEAYSFEDMKRILEIHEIESHGYEFDDLEEIRALKHLSCFQIINEFGQFHFVLAKSLKNFRWIVYDPAKTAPLIWNDQQLLAVCTNKVLIYEFATKDFKTETNFANFKLWLMIFSKNFFEIIILNFLLVISLVVMVIANAFLRIVFQDYKFLTLNRLFLLTLSLIALLFLNYSFNYLIQRLILWCSNNFFKKIIRTERFATKFTKATTYLLINDFEKTYFEFQNNLYHSMIIWNQLPGLMGFTIFLSYYFYQESQLLFLSSLGLILLLLGLNILKLKIHSKNKQHQDYRQNWYLYKTELLLKNFKVIQNKTNLRNYLTLKKLDDLLIYQVRTFIEPFRYLERFLIYLYYLMIGFLLSSSNYEISSLIIFTSMTMVTTSQFEQIFQSWFQFKNNNYFNDCFLVKKEPLTKIENFQISFRNKALKTNFLIIKLDELKEVKLNYQNIFDIKSWIYFASEAINFQDNIYNNIFNYQQINLEIFFKTSLIKIIEDYQLNLEQLVNQTNQEIVSYLSCFFAKQNIIVTKLPENKDLVKLLVETFLEKTFIFIDET